MELSEFSDNDECWVGWLQKQNEDQNWFVNIKNFSCKQNLRGLKGALSNTKSNLYQNNSKMISYLLRLSSMY